MNAALGEFGRIASIFAPLTEDHADALGLADDAALVPPDLVMTTDTIVEGVDFLPDDPPDLVARKLLRVNLSDLAAMAARPEAYLLTTILPARIDDSWLQRFARGLAEDQRTFGIRLIGGDSGSTPGPMVFSATMLGRGSRDRIVRRRGAAAGDTVFVSGTIGDSALGLLLLTGRSLAADEAGRQHLIDRYRLPEPRVALGMALAGHASAMIDVSDGLVADLDHLCAASGVGAIIRRDLVPLSAAAASALAAAPDLLLTVLSGGDDYELVFTAPAAAVESIHALAAAAGTPVQAIGRIDELEASDRPCAIVVGSDGRPLRLPRRGWVHA